MIDILFIYFVPMILTIIFVQLNDYLWSERKKPFDFYFSLFPIFNLLVAFVHILIFITRTVIFIGEKFFVSKK